MQIFIRNKNTLLFDEFKFKCSTGKKDIPRIKKKVITRHQKEYIKLALYFTEKINIQILIQTWKKKLLKEMGWCDDVRSKYYNKLIKINKQTKHRHEKLYRNDRKYDLLVPIHYNTKKPKK